MFGMMSQGQVTSQVHGMPGSMVAHKHCLAEAASHNVQNRHSTSAQTSNHAAVVKNALDSDGQHSSYMQADLKYVQALADVSEET